mmetsp:Transcript_23288/g.72832  ORF Transcript_23288/g.72832 Transcript_23288/m.72832 type:complete len:317 (-) Transcript_23288:307-1257(-)
MATFQLCSAASTARSLVSVRAFSRPSSRCKDTTSSRASERRCACSLRRCSISSSFSCAACCSTRSSSRRNSASLMEDAPSLASFRRSCTTASTDAARSSASDTWSFACSSASFSLRSSACAMLSSRAALVAADCDSRSAAWRPSRSTCITSRLLRRPPTFCSRSACFMCADARLLRCSEASSWSSFFALTVSSRVSSRSACMLSSVLAVSCAWVSCRCIVRFSSRSVSTSECSSCTERFSDWSTSCARSYLPVMAWRSMCSFAISFCRDAFVVRSFCRDLRSSFSWSSLLRASACMVIFVVSRSSLRLSVRDSSAS